MDKRDVPSGLRVSRRVTASLLPIVALLLLAVPSKLSAQEVYDTITEAETTESVIVENAGWAASIQQWITQNYDDLIQPLISSLSTQVNALANLTVGQAQVDAMARETQKQANLHHSMDGLMLLPGGANGYTNGPGDQTHPGQNTGYNACNMSNRNTISSHTRVQEFGQAVAAFTTQNAPSNGSPGGNQDLLQACVRGFADTRPGSPVYAETQALHCPDSSSFQWTSTNPDGSQTPLDGNYYVDADTKPDTITAPWYYSVPAGTTISKSNQLSLPVKTQKKEEQDFIAAIYACKMFREPATPADTSANTADKASVKTGATAANKRRNLISSLGTNNVCIREIARRTRVSKATASADTGSILANLYIAQLARCTSQNAEGIWNYGFKDKATDLLDCQTNGRSEAEMDRNEKCKHDDSKGYGIYIAGTGMSVDKSLELQAQKQGECTDYMLQWEKDNREVDNALINGAKTLRANSNSPEFQNPADKPTQ